MFFDRKPACRTPWTKTLWICDFRTNEHFTLKTNPQKPADLDGFVACYNSQKTPVTLLAKDWWLPAS